VISGEQQSDSSEPVAAGLAIRVKPFKRYRLSKPAHQKKRAYPLLGGRRRW